MALPKRTADTMSDAIAIASPNGRMSKRALAAAQRRLAIALFGTNGDDLKGKCQQPTERERLLQQAARLRDLAARGMSRKAFTKEADALEAQAAQL